jgi:glycosyltransferase involved in cell wall biosynthesis
MPRLGLIPRIAGVAGPAGFQQRLALGLTRRGFEISFEPGRERCEALLVVGGTRSLGLLRRARGSGIPVFQRLDGMNWIHRRRPSGVSHFVRAELNNLLLRLIRDRLADAVVYQSDFARAWWERAHGPAPGPSQVIRNAVPLDVYTPEGPRWPSVNGTRVVVLEGALGGGYEVGLSWAAGVARRLAELRGAEVTLSIAGESRGRIPSLTTPSGVRLEWLGRLEAGQVPALLRSGDLLFSADLHPACPNSVIEALACGLPVAAFDTGAISEILDDRCGAVVPYGADPWRVDPPDLEGLARAAATLLEAGERYRVGARRRAEAAFGLDRMLDQYLHAFGW